MTPSIKEPFGVFWSFLNYLTVNTKEPILLIKILTFFHIQTFKKQNLKSSYISFVLSPPPVPVPFIAQILVLFLKPTLCTQLGLDARVFTCSSAFLGIRWS